MIIVKLTNYERNDLVRVLESAMENYKSKFKNKKITEYEYSDYIDKISTLKKRINGVTPQNDFGLQKTMESLLFGEN